MPGPSRSPHAVQSENQRNGAGNQQDLQRDIIQPMLRERRVGLFHHATSQVVTGLPSASLPSFSTTPIATSSSRMRSDSAKSLRARAAARAAINVSTWL